MKLLQYPSVYKNILALRGKRVERRVLDQIHLDRRGFETGHAKNRILIGFEKTFHLCVADERDRVGKHGLSGDRECAKPHHPKLDGWAEFWGNCSAKVPRAAERLQRVSTPASDCSPPRADRMCAHSLRQRRDFRRPALAVAASALLVSCSV